TDGGRMMEERRIAQATADAAALAAAVEKYKRTFSTSANPQNAALDSASANGYTNDGVNTIVTVNIPPTSGVFSGQADCIEVITECNLRATFGAIFPNQPISVRGRAVARGRPLKIGVMALSPNAAGAFTNNAVGTFAVVGASIYVNSTHPAAFKQQGIGP